MENYNWITNKNTFIENKKKILTELRDTFILIVLSLLTGVLSIGKFSSMVDPNKIWDRNVIVVGKYFIEYNKVPNKIIYIPLFCVFFLLLLLFFIFRYKETKTLPNKLITTIGLILFIGNIIGLFFFSPKGDYTYISPIENGTYNTSITVSYNGLELVGKIYESIALFLFGSYFILVFTYVKSLSNYVVPIFRLALVVPIIIALVLLIYSFIKEGNEWITNIKYYLNIVDKKANIISLTTHKNMFGFFLFLASLSFLILFCKYHYIILYIIPSIFNIFSLLIFSKTSTILILTAYIIVGIIYFVINLKTRKFNSIISLIVLILFSLISTCIFYFIIKNGLYKKFLENNTLTSRYEHFVIAKAMFINQPFFRWIFGYGRISFTSIYSTFENQVHFEVLWTSHNCYMDVFAAHGFFGVFEILSCDFYILYCISDLIFKKKRYECLVYYPVFLILCIYSFFEPRMLFLISGGTEMFLFYFVILFPVLLDYGHSKNNGVLI